MSQFNGPAPLAWRWAQSTERSPSGTPVVIGDTVYLTLGDRAYALDKDTGNQKWRFPIGIANLGNFQGMPAISGNTVALAAESHYVYGVDRSDAKQKWEHFLPKPILGAPVAAGKYIAVAESDNKLYALDADTGAEVWKTPVDVDGGFTGSMASYEDTVIFFNTLSEMVCYDIPNQKQLWKIRFTMIDSRAKPVVYGDAIYVNTGSYLAAVNVASGRGLWETNVGTQLAFEPAVGPDNIVCITQDGLLMSFDRNGNKLFRNPVDIGTVPVASAASVGSMFLVPSGNGAINLVNPKTGENVWSFVIGPMDKLADTAQPQRAANTGRNSATPVATGPTKFVPAAGPAILAGQTLLILARDGSLLAFDKNTGVDLTPPTVKMIEPNPGDQVSGQPPLDFAFTIQDDASGVQEKTVKVMLDGAPVDFDKTKEHYYIVRVSTDGPVKPLPDGRHTLTVMATDWMGNTGTTSFNVMIDNSLRPKGSILPKDQKGAPRGGSGGRGGGAFGGG